ncbi:hypothetical protein I4F81_005763 [Pyropia yezoensis]|uniref:Uncharacterized protein n=1 Tax=Pyropia yezoensis TaxID=2788 RepID=A0ACC3C083_PYRYE|nr:hypothetical protein I4F81_005763 [Neopyropia yezoensis]
MVTDQVSIRRFALISDVHIFNTEGFWYERALDFTNRRVFGLLNILMLRGPDKFSRHVLASSMDDMRANGVDHLVIAGDVTNLAIECEFALSKEYFSRFGPPANITAVPGNHDVYTGKELKRRLFAKYFGEYAQSDVPVVSPRDDGFPFLQARGGVAFLGLNTGIPGSARGLVGPAQFDAARKMLTSPEGKALLARTKTLIMVLHHPTQDPKMRGLPRVRDIGHDLIDWEDVAAFCREFPIAMTLHGHNHVPYQGRLTLAPDTYVYESGSGTLLADNPSRIARYTVFELDDAGTLARTFARVWNPETAKFDSLELPLPTMADVGVVAQV